MDEDLIREAQIANMVGDARRRIARTANYPCEHHRCVTDGHERHFLACRGVEIAVDPTSRSSMDILQLWIDAFDDAARI